MRRILLVTLVLIAVIALTACAAPAQVPTSKLELLSTRDERGYGSVIMYGEVRNIAGIPLKNVMVVVRYYTADGEFVKSAEALVAYNPIMPNQVSPFTAIVTDNPLIQEYTVRFKFLFGTEIPTRDVQKRQ